VARSVVGEAAAAAARHGVPLLAAVHAGDPLGGLSDRDLALVQGEARLRPRHVLPLSRRGTPAERRALLRATLDQARGFYAGEAAAGGGGDGPGGRLQGAVLAELSGQLGAAAAGYGGLLEASAAAATAAAAAAAGAAGARSGVRARGGDRARARARWRRAAPLPRARRRWRR